MAHELFPSKLATDIRLETKLKMQGTLFLLPLKAWTKRAIAFVSCKDFPHVKYMQTHRFSILVILKHTVYSVFLS